MTRKPQQRMEAECNSTGAWQARFAYLNHSGGISRCKDWAVDAFEDVFFSEIDYD